MNLIKNFFHAFGDIILGLLVVGIAVFLIGTQISSDFDVFTLGNKAYDKVMTKITGNEPATTEPVEILSDPVDSNIAVTDTSDDGEPITKSSDEQTPADAVSTNDAKDGASDDVKNTDDKTTPIVPEAVPTVRNITISNGSTADQVASGLFANGIIGTKEEFLAEYARLSVGRSIIGGNFQIPSNSTPAEILAIIAPEQTQR